MQHFKRNVDILLLFSYIQLTPKQILIPRNELQELLPRLTLRLRSKEGRLSLIFEWDEKKADDNLRKHGVSFDEAKTVFNDPFSVTIYDPDHVSDKERYIDIGLSSKGRLIVVSYIERGEKIRIISSREATRKEQGEYENK
jgi:hypothetical protein